MTDYSRPGSGRVPVLEPRSPQGSVLVTWQKEIQQFLPQAVPVSQAVGNLSQDSLSLFYRHMA